MVIQSADGKHPQIYLHDVKMIRIENFMYIVSIFEEHTVDSWEISVKRFATLHHIGVIRLKYIIKLLNMSCLLPVKYNNTQGKLLTFICRIDTPSENINLIVICPVMLKERSEFQ